MKIIFTIQWLDVMCWKCGTIFLLLTDETFDPVIGGRMTWLTHPLAALARWSIRVIVSRVYTRAESCWPHAVIGR